MTKLLARRWPDILVPALLVVLAMTPLLPVFGTGRLVAAAVGGTLLGAGLAVAGKLRRWGALTVLAAGVVVLVVASALGAPQTALAGIVPTPETVGAVAQGVVTSWKQIVTVLPPLGAGGSMLTAPFLLGLVGACVAVTVALRTRRPVLALVPPAVVLAVSVLLGTADEATAVPLGLVLAMAGLVWAAWRTTMHPGRWAGAGALALAGVVAGTAVGLLAPPDAPRLVLRERIEPPPDLRDYPSPLAGFRSHVKDHRDDALVTVDGLPEGTPMRLAVLDSYDGTAWQVSGAGTAGSGQFTRIGDRIEPRAADDLVTATVTVGAYSGVWVPLAGRSHDVDFTGARAEDLTRTLHVNRATGTGLVTAGLRKGDQYQLVLKPVSPPGTSELEGAAISDVELPTATFPEVATTAAAAMTAEAVTPLAQIQAIQGGLQQGYFSHGLEGETPSLAGHGAARIDELLGGDAMVGDEEQYAAAMGLMLRAIGIPSRVVMGLEHPGGSGPVDLTGDLVTAWVEVPFEGHGWVPFDPTPDEDRIWQAESPVPQNKPQPQVLQPPPPAQEPPEPPPSDRQEVDVDDEEEQQEATTPVALIVAAIAGGTLLVLLLPLLLILALKLRRRSKRRRRGTTSERVAGGWAELVDVATDLGVEVPAGATRRQAALAVVGGPASNTLAAPAAALAARADEGTFGPVEPDDAHVSAFWSEVDAVVRRLRASVGRRRWWRARVSTRSLRGGRTPRPARTPRRSR